jgi:hypothetical protein
MVAKRFVTIGSGFLEQKIQMHKSPSGKYYLGKTPMVTRSVAEGRAQEMRQSGYWAWVEGNTVYSRPKHKLSARSKGR